MSTLKSESGGNSSESIYGSYSFIGDRKPCKGNSSSLDSVFDAKCWLHHHGIGRCYSHDQLNVFAPEIELLTASCVNGNAKASAANQLIEEYYTTYPKIDSAFCSDGPSKHFNCHCDSLLQEFKSTINDDLLSNAHLMDLDSCNSLLFERPKKLCSDLDSQWIGLKKIEPWWHTADKGDLASLVSQRSSHYIVNCDLPEVQNTHVVKVSGGYVNYLDQVKDRTINEETTVSHEADFTHKNLDSVSTDKSLGKRGLMDCMLQESDRNFSSRDGFSTSKVDSPDTQESTGGDLSRDQLLEALCHSQTRAREAEKSAQKACDEKDHIFNLFFHQASCLFAYRLWLRMLQLERLCLQLRSNNQISSFTTPSLLPWVRSKGVILRKNRKRVSKKKPGGKRDCMRKCAIAFAVGLSLAGAGLLVGWTIGWFFPAI
ncbi:hypothetical protein BUALT_Bualt01G0081800 [Buddleja alternifolia]|uniref:Uncharacterized protein n=1 Tax=Buddleja alternifolia TaxID=168488 RepID=A0AAV6Y6U3_9LAMI|nr:hypothetical protein BUALT_Bualt01G0081800 [Buddleja alternifolia]